ncbi:TetR/AcrR family transcriptional regulator C-terminal domain-containing protein [Deinococcus marmoris]|uniref:Transcriptional regulator, TetR family n=1 Tax=Deinococcus marmoris TaxID=249408 RepID=A0A1U7NQY5_9DEIO|nr:TetR/AcrR family transcriptional regulator C-terminal domain-containing protein [Deinococcus marmoris]OLV15329.1 transcriptional regulator, TetR family [Deinococcus marmoris]
MFTPQPTTTARRSPLSREEVLHAAIRLADEGGIAELTMRKLADKLGIQAMSLYHHVANKDELLDAMVDAVFREIEVVTENAPWKPAMRQRAVSARQTLLRHAWALGMMESRANPGQATLECHDAVLGCLRRAGFSVALAAHAFSVLDSYIYGFVLQELNLPFQNPDDLQRVSGSILQNLPADTYPHLMEMMTAHVSQPGYAYADEFMFGLDLILDGLEQALGVRTQPDGCVALTGSG